MGVRYVVRGVNYGGVFRRLSRVTGATLRMGHIWDIVIISGDKYQIITPLALGAPIAKHSPTIYYSTR